MKIGFVAVTDGQTDRQTRSGGFHTKRRSSVVCNYPFCVRQLKDVCIDLAHILIQSECKDETLCWVCSLTFEQSPLEMSTLCKSWTAVGKWLCGNAAIQLIILYSRST